MQALLGSTASDVWVSLQPDFVLEASLPSLFFLFLLDTYSPGGQLAAPWNETVGLGVQWIHYVFPWQVQAMESLLCCAFWGLVPPKMVTSGPQRGLWGK